MKIESQVRVAIRDAVNLKSRKPFYWGGLKGYEQFEAIDQVLQSVLTDEPETDYLQYLRTRVERVVKSNRVLAQDLREAHTWLRCVAKCLRYPPSSFPTAGTPADPLSSEQIKREMEELMQEFQPDFKRYPAQAGRLWL